VWGALSGLSLAYLAASVCTAAPVGELAVVVCPRLNRKYSDVIAGTVGQ